MTRLPSLRSLLFLLLLAPLSAFCADTGEAFAALQHGRVAEAERSLRTTLASDPRDARAHQLLCRVFYMQERGSEAVTECEAAVSAAPNDSVAIEWLGRAYGLKATHANPLSAFSLAKRVRSTFERAVQADPRNVDAISDLGQFYVGAPSIAGGDIGRARQLAATLQSLSPTRAHRLLAYIADSSHDSATAEAEFKAAVATGHTPESYTDLALFYRQQHQPDQAAATLRDAFKTGHITGPALPDAASILIEANRSLDLAEQALRDYIASPNQTEDSPVFKAHLKLGKLLLTRGDKAGAQREFAAALALAPNFAPARDAMKGA